MSVIIETNLGDITIDLYTQERPKSCLNFLKLCRLKAFNFNLFHHVQRNFILQTGDPTGTGRGGESVYKHLYGDQATYVQIENTPRIKHKKKGTVSFVNNGHDQIGSQFFITSGEGSLGSLDAGGPHGHSGHVVVGEVVEGWDVISAINESYCDPAGRPYKDIRIFHTVVLDDPFADPEGLPIPDASPPITAEALKSDRLGVDDDPMDDQGLDELQLNEKHDAKEAKARATVLELVGDINSVDDAPPENVLFVCKLNPVTSEEDLQIIFSRFGTIQACDIIKDKRTGDSLQYAFIEFDKPEDCERAYFKMDNVLIDDRRIHVDFSQSVAKNQLMALKEQKRRKREGDGGGKTSDPREGDGGGKTSDPREKDGGGKTSDLQGQSRNEINRNKGENRNESNRGENRNEIKKVENHKRRSENPPSTENQSSAKTSGRGKKDSRDENPWKVTGRVRNDLPDRQTNLPSTENQSSAKTSGRGRKDSPDRQTNLPSTENQSSAKTSRRGRKDSPDRQTNLPSTENQSSFKTSGRGRKDSPDRQTNLPSTESQSSAKTSGRGRKDSPDENPWKVSGRGRKDSPDRRIPRRRDESPPKRQKSRSPMRRENRREDRRDRSPKDSGSKSGDKIARDRSRDKSPINKDNRREERNYSRDDKDLPRGELKERWAKSRDDGGGWSYHNGDRPKHNDRDTAQREHTSAVSAERKTDVRGEKKHRKDFEREAKKMKKSESESDSGSKKKKKKKSKKKKKRKHKSGSSDSD